MEHFAEQIIPTIGYQERLGKGSNWLRLRLPNSYCPVVLCAAYELRYNKSPRPRSRPIVEQPSSRKWETPQTTSPSKQGLHWSANLCPFWRSNARVASPALVHPPLLPKRLPAECLW